MGSIQVDDGSTSRHEPLVEQVEATTSQVSPAIRGDQFRHFQVPGLATDDAASVSGMREELVLVSWLIVLWRTREDAQVSYDWAYRGWDIDIDHETATPPICLSTDEIATGMQTKVEEASTSISRHLTRVREGSAGPWPSPASLILSTETKSRSDGEETAGLQLELRFVDDDLLVRPLPHDADKYPSFLVNHHIQTLVDTIQHCLSYPTATIEQCMRPTRSDIDQIWEWNHAVVPTYDLCMQDVVAEQARKTPTKEAVVSWDGTLTYAQVDQYSSFLAYLLLERGVKANDYVPVCFEKSRWASVAVLGVMKAGATMVLMDPTLPLARLQNMAQQVGAGAMVASLNQADLAGEILPDGKVQTLGESTFSGFVLDSPLPALPAVSPSTIMYVIFTSGSTGTPKGVQISHRTYSSSAFPRTEAVGYNKESRVLDFASYAFDVSIDNMMLTLANGGCLCIPSDEDRLNDINGVIRDMKINYAGITPSMARILELEVIASLSCLGLGGEACSTRDVNYWGQFTRIVIGYGPCECTVGCTINSSAATGRDITLGPGNGANIWLVHPDDHDSLVPIGAVGELLVEGPIVGQGYLNDPEKTAASFIDGTTWLGAGHKNFAGRSGRMYKTGDLGRYDPFGSGEIIFVGRKDTQVKLRGQRVELGEIESQLRERLPSDIHVVAEVITPAGTGSKATLVAFVAPQSKGHAVRDIATAELTAELRDALAEADASVVKVLPRYMVPSAYIPINHIPALISGKIDRKRLKLFGTTVDLRQIDHDQHQPQTAPTAAVGNIELSEAERRLREAWAITLKVDLESIQPEDNFFALGGDSLAAMRLVSVCRENVGLELTVIAAFGHPTLSAMAAVVGVSTAGTHVQKQRTPFSMLAKPFDKARLEASKICGISVEEVEDMYPCTATQESLFTFSLKSSEPYTAQRVARIPQHISLEEWKAAWERVVAENQVLRTRVVQLEDDTDAGLRQVVVKEGIRWRYGNKLSRYLEEDRAEKMNPGTSLARYAIVSSPDTGDRYMVWTMHHVVYDGWSEPVVLENVRSILRGEQLQPGPPRQMGDFVQYLHDSDQEASKKFWHDELEGAVGPQFPRLPSRDFVPAPDTVLERRFAVDTGHGFPFTPATLIRAAWALVASQYSGSTDVVFGETMTGRNIHLPGVEGIVGPLIATIPVRIRVDRTSLIMTYLQAVQESVLVRASHQHMGMQTIRKLSRDAQRACESGSGLVIQPDPDFGVCDDLGFDHSDVVQEAIHFNPYSFMLAVGILKDGFRVSASFDSNLVELEQAQRILRQVETACLQLTRHLDQSIEQVSWLPEAELSEIWRWNRVPPMSWDDSGAWRKLRAASSTERGSMYPRAAVPWVCGIDDPTSLSPIGCAGELWLEGPLFSADAVESPAWLLAGSKDCQGRSGRVQPTGDIVKMQGDGTVVFLGRKEDIVLIGDHSINLADLEVHFPNYLAPSTLATAIVIPTRSSSRASEHGLIVFVEQAPVQEGIKAVKLLSEKHSLAPGSNINPCIPTELAVALRRLDKFLHGTPEADMLASFTYVVVDCIPTKCGQMDRRSLVRMASSIPQKVLDQIQEGFDGAWKSRSTKVEATSAEDILRLAWAKVLSVDVEQIDVDDNFFRLGGDSVLAMKLVSHLRSQGHRLTVADIFRHMRLGNAAKALRVGKVAEVEVKAPSHQPFSLLGPLDVNSFLSDVVRPKLANSTWAIQDMYPVTDSQALDINATLHGPRTSMQYTMLYFREGIDKKKLINACHQLVKTHDILRTVFIEIESSFAQVVLGSADDALVLTEMATEGDLAQFVEETCKSHIESEFRLGSSFLRIFLVEGQDGQLCLALGLSHALYDGISLPRLLRDLEAIFVGDTLSPFQPFSAYMAHIFNQKFEVKALDYWKGLLRGSTLSVLDRPSLARDTRDRAIFKTSPVDVSHKPAEITIANLLTAAWALVVARRLRSSDVTFGSITSGRTMEEADMEAVVGPCYQFTPVRVPFQYHWTAMDLLHFVQKQGAQSSAHDFVGFERIAKQCTQWSPEARMFDSVVHHQDVEYFDDMPFAGGSCKVDILNPHGDAAYPLKVVSFVKEEQMYVGIVGSEKETAFVDAVLTELAVTVEELAILHTEFLMLDGDLF
ncbi:hypothetical protein QBC39DRAFT_420964 [Podospora conica]|nr:hypothetical protein QBC39DRAFT_420964 [Schizothecium conicum]